MPLLLLLLAFEHRLNPLRSLYRENRIEYIGKRGNFWGGKKIEEGKKKKERGGEKRRKNGGGKNRGTRHSRAAVHCAARLKRNCRKTVREYSLFHVNKFNSLRPIKNRRIVFERFYIVSIHRSNIYHIYIGILLNRPPD